MSSRTRSRLGGLLAVSACAVFTLAPAAAHAVPLPCGTTIGTDTTLDTDVAGCAGDALVVTADNVTVDLAGHTLTGTGSDAGVRIPPGVTGVTVRGGTIRDFAQGVVVDSAQGNRIQGVRLIDDERGIDLANAQDTIVMRNLVRGAGADGIRVDGYGSSGNRILANAVSDRVWGIMVSGGATGTQVSGNSLFGNEHGIVLWESVSSLAEENIVMNSADDGIWVTSGTPSTVVRRNVAMQSRGDGLLIEDRSASLASNIAMLNRGHGIDAPSGAVTSSLRNIALFNATSPQCLGIKC